MKNSNNLIFRCRVMAVMLALLLQAGALAQIQYNNADWGVHPMPYSRVGTAGFQFLKLHTNARSAAMGGVMAATAFGDARSAFTNPASAADVRGTDLFFSSMKWVAEIQYSGVSVIHQLGAWGTVGLNLAYLDFGSMVRTEYLPDVNENMLPVTEGLGTFGAHDMAIGVLYSRQITDQLQLGGNIRYVEEQLDDAKTYTWSVDIGTLYWTGLGSWRISMLGRNFGPDAQYTSYYGRVAQAPVNVRMPMMLVIGSAYDVLEYSAAAPHRLTIAADYVKPNDGPEKVNLGAEYFFYNNFYARGGYRFNYDEETFTFGFGAEYAVVDDVRIKFDYAYAATGRFNQVHMLTAGLGF